MHNHRLPPSGATRDLAPNAFRTKMMVYDPEQTREERGEVYAYLCTYLALVDPDDAWSPPQVRRRSVGQLN